MNLQLKNIALLIKQWGKKTSAISKRSNHNYAAIVNGSKGCDT